MASSKLAGGDPVLASKLNETTMGSTAPASPVEGWLWLDTTVASNPILKQYNGSLWIVAGVSSDLTHFGFWP